MVEPTTESSGPRSTAHLALVDTGTGYESFDLAGTATPHEPGADRDLARTRRIKDLLKHPVGQLVELARAADPRSKPDLLDATAVATGAVRQHYRLVHLAELALQLQLNHVVDPDELVDQARHRALLRSHNSARQSVIDALDRSGAARSNAFEDFVRHLRRNTALQMSSLVPYALQTIELGVYLRSAASEGETAGRGRSRLSDKTQRFLARATPCRIAQILVAVTREVSADERDSRGFLTHQELYELFDLTGVWADQGSSPRLSQRNPEAASAALSRDISDYSDLRGRATNIQV